HALTRNHRSNRCRVRLGLPSSLDLHNCEGLAVASNVNPREISCCRAVDVTRRICPSESKIVSILRNSQVFYGFRNANEGRERISDFAAGSQEKKQKY